MTDVTIRGIEDEVYAGFAAEAKRRGLAIGELTTQIMQAVLQQGARPIYRIGNLDELSVSKRDLESMDGPVIFSNIDSLEFEGDVEWQLFKERVERIENVDEVIISKSLSKFQILTKAKNVESVRSKK
jgi:hypothetical protein